LNFFNGFEYDPTPEAEAMVYGDIERGEKDGGEELRGWKCARRSKWRIFAGEMIEKKKSTNRTDGQTEVNKKQCAMQSQEQFRGSGESKTTKCPVHRLDGSVNPLRPPHSSKLSIRSSPPSAVLFI